MADKKGPAVGEFAVPFELADAFGVVYRSSEVLARAKMCVLFQRGTW